MPALSSKINNILIRFEHTRLKRRRVFVVYINRLEFYMNSFGDTSSADSSDHLQSLDSTNFNLYAITMTEVIRTHDLCQNLGDELVHLHVGPEKTKYSVHKKLFCSVLGWTDEYFADTPDFNMKDEEPKIVKVFIQWMYQKSLSLRYTVDGTFPLDDGISLYKFAEDYGFIRLQNEVMDLLQDNLHTKKWIWLLRHFKDACDYTSGMWTGLLHNFTCAILYHQFFVSRSFKSRNMVNIFKDSRTLMVQFLKFQLIMNDAGHPTANPKQRGASEFYHNCYFHCHNNEQERQECVSRGT